MIHVHSGETPWTERPGYSKKPLVTGDQIGAPGTLVQLLRIRPGEVADSHFHKGCTEVFYFPGEAGERTVNGQKVHIQTGDVLVIQPGDHHTVRNSGTEDVVYIAFKVNVVEDDYFESKQA